MAFPTTASENDVHTTHSGSIFKYTSGKWNLISGDDHYEKGSCGTSFPAVTVTDNQKIMVVDSTGNFVLQQGLSGLTALPPLGLPFAIPSVDFANDVANRTPNTPIFYTILDNGVQNTIRFVNSSSNLFLLRNGVRTTITEYTAKQGEIVIVIKDINGDVVISTLANVPSTGIANNLLPEYANRATAVSAITIGNGYELNRTYQYYNSTTFGVEAVRL